MSESQFVTTDDSYLIDKRIKYKKILPNKIFENSIRSLKSQSIKSKTIEQELLEIDKMCSEFNINFNENKEVYSITENQMNIKPYKNDLLTNNNLNQVEITDENTKKYIPLMNINTKSKNIYKSSNKDKKLFIEKSTKNNCNNDKKLLIEKYSNNNCIKTSSSENKKCLYNQRMKIKNFKNGTTNCSSSIDSNYINNIKEPKKLNQSKNKRVSIPVNKQNNFLSHSPLHILNKRINTNSKSKCNIVENTKVNPLDPITCNLNEKNSLFKQLDQNTSLETNNNEQKYIKYDSSYLNNCDIDASTKNKVSEHYEYNFNINTMQVTNNQTDSLQSEEIFDSDYKSSFIDNLNKQCPLSDHNKYPIEYTCTMSSPIMKLEILNNVSISQNYSNYKFNESSKYYPPEIPEPVLKKFSPKNIVRPVTMMSPSSPVFLPFSNQQTIRMPTIANNDYFKNDSIQNSSRPFQSSVQNHLSDLTDQTYCSPMGEKSNNLLKIDKKEISEDMDKQTELQNTDNYLTHENTNCCEKNNLNLKEYNQHIFKLKHFSHIKNVNIESNFNNDSKKIFAPKLEKYEGKRRASVDNNKNNLMKLKRWSDIPKKSLYRPDQDLEIKNGSPMFELSLIMETMTYGCNGASYLDAHCHLDILFNGRKKEANIYTFNDLVTKKSYIFPNNFKGCITVFCYVNDWKSYLEPESFFIRILRDERVWGAVGCHPKDSNGYDSVKENYLIKLLEHSKIKALGEIGLDFSNGNSNIEIQKSVLKRQLVLAIERKLPVVIHCRDAEEETLNILKEELPSDYFIHRHCFLSTWEYAEKWLSSFSNCFLSFTPGIALACSSNLSMRKVIALAPLNRILIETDAPYFIPFQFQKLITTSWPSFSIATALVIAEIKNIPISTVLHTTYQNTMRLYNLEPW